MPENAPVELFTPSGRSWQRTNCEREAATTISSRRTTPFPNGQAMGLLDANKLQPILLHKRLEVPPHALTHLTALERRLLVLGLDAFGGRVLVQEVDVAVEPISHSRTLISTRIWRGVNERDRGGDTDPVKGGGPGPRCGVMSDSSASTVVEPASPDALVLHLSQCRMMPMKGMMRAGASGSTMSACAKQKEGR